MRLMHVVYGLVIATLGGCAMMPSRPLTVDDQQSIREAGHEFVSAVRAGDADRLRNSVVVDAPMKTLGDDLVTDTADSRMVIRELAARFDYNDDSDSTVASNPWLDQFDSAAQSAPIHSQPPTGDAARACVVTNDDTAVLYLRQVDGIWKVELISTLVPEAKGQPQIDNPAVTYRIGVSRAVSQASLQHLTRADYKTKADFDRAQNTFWMRFLATVAGGQDPHDTLMGSLPVMPRIQSAADER